MDGQEPVAAETVETPSPTVETLTITVRQDGAMNIASDPPLDRWQVVGLLTTLLKAL